MVVAGQSRKRIGGDRRSRRWQPRRGLGAAVVARRVESDRGDKRESKLPSLPPCGCAMYACISLSNEDARPCSPCRPINAERRRGFSEREIALASKNARKKCRRISGRRLLEGWNALPGVPDRRRCTTQSASSHSRNCVALSTTRATCCRPWFTVWKWGIGRRRGLTGAGLPQPLKLHASWSHQGLSRPPPDRRRIESVRSISFTNDMGIAGRGHVPRCFPPMSLRL